MSHHAIIWTVATVVTATVVVRPFDWPEAVGAVNRAALRVMSGLPSTGNAFIVVITGRADARSTFRKPRAVSPRHLCSPSDPRTKSPGCSGSKLIFVRGEEIR